MRAIAAIIISAIRLWLIKPDGRSGDAVMH
ncbi:hypothetical protein DES53_108159 [Roseimicrobium gellanilyticum]|uniref:Uncharacterized protein n=1 Tax=Roseimicrobium gellanilyticum TaxID=748857 RepID=A0A366HDB9_9BACT|nr:hypothetical protein DES53_108159 [Roseimicrobium gellanilyticum]